MNAYRPPGHVGAGRPPLRPPDRGGGGGSRPPARGGQPYGGRQQPSLPSGYLQRGYFDEKGNPLPEVVQDWPKHIAQALAQERMSTAQLRGRFFGEVRRLEKKLVTTGDFDSVRPEILKLKAFAEYAANKKESRVPPLFRDFIERNIAWAARGAKEFQAGFVNHFECLVGYYPEVRGR